MSLAVVKPDANVLAEEPIGDDQVDVVVAIDVNTSDSETQRIVVKNRERVGGCIAAELKLNAVKIAIRRTAKTLTSSEVGRMVTIEIGQHPTGFRKIKSDSAGNLGSPEAL